MFIGDAAGNLHKFTGVFNGQPAEVTSGWPIAISAASALTSPVGDLTLATPTIYVGTAAGTIAWVPTSGGTATVSSAFNGVGFADAPIVDSGAGAGGTGLVYAFVGNAGGAAGSRTQVFQLTGNFGPGTSGASSGGITSATGTFFAGAFDNAYYTSSPSNRTGNLFVCGGNTPSLFKIPISGNSFGTPVTGPALASGGATCSPITEFNNGTDYLFFSVSNSAVLPAPTTACTLAATGGVGCLYSFNAAVSGFGTGSVGLNAANVRGGASGIVIDNAGSAGGESQVYFTYLTQSAASLPCPAPSNATSGGCAVQLSQSGLN